MRRRLALLAVAGAVVAADAPARAAEPLDDRASPASSVQEILASERITGASAALVRGGELVWHASFGVTDLRTNAPVTDDTVFEAASLGKVAAAYASLLLIEAGRWSLDMPVRSRRLEVRQGCPGPTLGQLLSHTAGLGNDLLASRFEPACDLPEGFSYAGQGFLVLQDLIEAESGETADRFIERRIFEPLGMRRTGYRTPDPATMATGHVDPLFALLIGGADRPVVTIATLVASAIVALGILVAALSLRRTRWARAVLLGVAAAAGGLAIAGVTASYLVVPTRGWSSRVLLPSSLHTTALDQARFAIELMRPTRVRPETRDLLFAPLAEVNQSILWGAGIGIDRSSSPPTFWHWGSNPGFQALLVLEPMRSDAAVILTNTGGGLDHVTGRHSGHEASKRIVRSLLRLDGTWDIR